MYGPYMNSNQTYKMNNNKTKCVNTEFDDTDEMTECLGFA